MPTEADTCRTLITPKLQAAGWEHEPHSIAEQRAFTDGRIIVHGSTATNGVDIIEFDYITGLERRIPSFPTPADLWPRLRTAQNLADRNFLVDDPKDKIFAPFGDARWKIEGGVVSLGRELYFSTYQSIAKDERRPGLYQEFPRDFFDLVIDDGFLAPYRVHRIVTQWDAAGWRPSKDDLDRYGREIPDDLYTTADFERRVALRARTRAVARQLVRLAGETNQR